MSDTKKATGRFKRRYETVHHGGGRRVSVYELMKYLNKSLGPVFIDPKPKKEEAKALLKK